MHLKRRVGVLVHTGRRGALAAFEEIGDWCKVNGFEVVNVLKSSDCLGLGLIVSLGGDGTMLRAIDLSLAYQIPVLGVNFGHLGYLTEIEPAELSGSLDKFFEGNYRLEERMTLNIEVYPMAVADRGRGSREHLHFVALNELVVEKSFSGNVVKLSVGISGKHFLDYEADGLIVATPTGSTAYSFSARGPIVSPSLSALVMTPISPHMLFDRALILAPTERVEITIMDGQDATLMVDGINRHSLSMGEMVSVGASPLCANIVKFSERDFREILKQKFGLGEKKMYR